MIPSQPPNLSFKAPTLCPPGGRQRDQLSLPSPELALRATLSKQLSSGGRVRPCFSYAQCHSQCTHSTAAVMNAVLTRNSIHGSSNECCFHQAASVKPTPPFIRVDMMRRSLPPFFCFFSLLYACIVLSSILFPKASPRFGCGTKRMSSPQLSSPRNY